MALPVDVEATFIDPSNPADPASPPVYSGVELRRADAALVGGAGDTADPLKVRGGIVRHASNSLAVTVDGSDVVTIQPGAAVIPGNAVASGGVYRAALPVVTTGSLAARDATNGRIDLVIFRALDPDAVGAHPARTGRIEVLTGTPSGTPAVPALPTLAVELARVTVPASGGGAATIDNTRRAYASAPGGVLEVETAAALPATALLRQRARAIDTGVEYEWDGAAWLDGSWSTYVPTWTAAVTNPAIGNGTITGRYRRIGKTVFFRVVIAAGSTTTYGSGQYSVSLPSAAHGTGREPLLAQAVIGGGLYPCRGLIGPSATTALLYCDPTSAGGFLRSVTASTPAAFANGSELVVQGFYEEP